jgi:hypothetical protein
MGIGNHKERISLDDTGKTAMFKLCEGNIGALNVLIQLTVAYERVDPDSALGDLTGLLSLDSFGIYGPRIWMLYKNVCGENIINMIAVLRAVQLGMLRRDMMDRAIDGGDLESAKIGMEEIKAAVQEQLPRFGRVTLEELNKKE